MKHKKSSKFGIRKVTGSNNSTKLPEVSWKLRFKSLFYKYTGWFIAYEEESDYLQCDLFWTEFKRMSKYNKANDMNEQNLQGLLIGLWHCEYGFARPSTFLRFKGYGKWYRPVFRFLSWWIDLYTVIKWDLRLLYRKLVG